MTTKSKTIEQRDESICESGRVAIDLASMRDKAISALVENLHVQGFTAGV